MSNKFKLLATAVGLILVFAIAAVLGTSNLSNAAATGDTTLRSSNTQASGIPSREEIKRILEAAFTALTAAGETIIWDIDKATFLSEFKGFVAFVPLHHSYQPRLFDIYVEWQGFENISVPIGGLYVVEPVKIKGLYNEGPEFALPKGAYVLQFEPVNPKTGVMKVAVVNKEGQTLGFITGAIHHVQHRPLKYGPFINTKQLGDHVLVEIEVPWYQLAKSVDSLLSHDAALGPIRDFLEGFAVGIAVVAAIVCLL